MLYKVAREKVIAEVLFFYLGNIFVSISQTWEGKVAFNVVFQIKQNSNWTISFVSQR
jgi:hypothetical protein